MAGSKNNIKNIEKISGGDHVVLFYEKESELIDAAFCFVMQSLKNGQKCIYIDEEKNHKMLLNKLENLFSGAKEFLNKDQLQLVIKEDIYGKASEFRADNMISLIEQKVIEAQKEGYKGLSITGELKEVINFEGGKKEIIKY